MSEKDDFLKQKGFSVTKWTPVTDIGCFDAIYNPLAGEITVTSKVFFSQDTKPQYQVWTDEEWLKWKAQALIEVNTFWSRRFLFKCVKKGWEDIEVKVNFEAIEMPTKGQAYFEAVVKKLAPTEPSSGGGVEWSAVPPKIDLDNMTIYPKDDKKRREAIFGMRVYMIQEAIKDNTVACIPFPKDSWTLDGPTKMKLLNFAKHMHRFATKDVTGIELVLYGSKGNDDGKFSIGLGKKRAKAVADVLMTVMRDETKVVVTDDIKKRSNLREAVERTFTANKIQTSATKFQGVVMTFNVPDTHPKVAEMNYKVICHEFGHVLGLPDEYTGALHANVASRMNKTQIISKTFVKVKPGSGNARVVKQQEGMGGLLKVNKDVRSPNFLSTSAALYLDDKSLVVLGSSSIMWSGMEVMPAHYLTIWNCLAEMTIEHLWPEEWKIVPSPENRDAIRYFK